MTLMLQKHKSFLFDYLHILNTFLSQKNHIKNNILPYILIRIMEVWREKSAVKGGN